MIEILMAFTKCTKKPDKLLRSYLDNKQIIDEQNELLLNLLANVTNESVFPS